MKVTVIANSAAYGNAAVLAEGLKHYCQVETAFRFADEKKMFDAKVNRDVSASDHYIVVGAVSLGALPRKYYNNGVTVILTDSVFMQDHDKYNSIFRANGWRVWAMPDLAPLAKTENIYYQPFIIPQLDVRKTELICHSPYCEAKMKQKGTEFIVAVCAKHNLPIEVITGKSWRETILIKARHRFFIDQIFRGLGKSGLEAMLLDCAVLSGVKPEGENLPPIVWTDKKNLETDLLRLIFDRQYTDDIVRNQKVWAVKNLDCKYVAGRIYDAIRK